MSKRNALLLGGLQEEDEQDDDHNHHQQLQVQIVVTPIQGSDGGAEIRIMGGTPRNSLHGCCDSQNCRAIPPSTSCACQLKCCRNSPITRRPVIGSIVGVLYESDAVRRLRRAAVFSKLFGRVIFEPRAVRLVVSCPEWWLFVGVYRKRDDMWTTLSRTVVSLCRGRQQQQQQHKRTAPILKNETCATSTSPIQQGMSELSLPITADQVSDYLANHSDFLERYIMDEVEVEQLERWIIRKSQRLKKKPTTTTTAAATTTRNGRKTSLSRWKFCVHADKRQMLQDLTNSLQLKPTKDHVLWELANCICSAVSADGFRLYIPDQDNPENLSLFLGAGCNNNNNNNNNNNSNNKKTSKSGEPKLQRITSGVSVPSYVARTLEPIRLSRGDTDPRFPDGIPNEGDIAHILCQALMQPDGQLGAVLELWRRENCGPFYEEDEEIASSYLVWGGIALHYAHLYLNMNKQRKLNDFVLAVVKSIFQDMVSMDMLVMKIMNFAQRLVDADRASLFLVDNRNKELYATIFDVGVERSENDDGENDKFATSDTSKEIRFPLGTGIAGQVAMTGEILNIKDAYADSRFNRTVDQLTGYRTNTILCMPIFIRGSIIGVVQMVNKHSGLFTREDEEAFEMFAVYCGLALHHAKLYDKIRKSEQKYRVALEVLSYHNSCTEEEFQEAVKEGIPETIIGIDDYYFNPFEIQDFNKAIYAMYMFIDLFGLNRFDKNSLMKFTLTVKKNYRRVPYHNWTHGFSVANSMYSIIKHAEEVFKPDECLALYIGALCHDLDHRGKNNKFMLDTESPLAAIYSTSTMEHHHFNQTVTILQQEGHNIFAKLSSNEYKQILSLLKHCILATDLAVFFPNKTKLNKLIEEQAFNWTNPEHRLLLQAISMTGSDLSASAKPWDIQVETVKVIFEEFYQQGDAEREAGRQPIPMMDRYQTDQQPASQVGFLMGICVPCYTLLNTLIPQTKPMLDMCQENLKRWQKIDKEIKAKRENPA